MSSSISPNGPDRILSAEQAEGLVIVAGSTYPEQGQLAAESIGTELGDLALKHFPNGELYAEFHESVRGKQVFIVQTDCARSINNPAEKPLHWSINDSVQETAIIIDAAARASAKEVTVIKPYFAYSRQDRKSSGRESVAAAVHMKQYQNVGMDRLVTVDLHSPQIGSMHQWFDNLSGANRLTKVVQTYAEDNGIELDDTVFVAPDGGSLKLPNFYVDRIKDGQAAVMQKTRQSDGAATHHAQRLDGFGGRTAVLVDDMIDTAGTVVSAAEILSRSGADKIILAATHGLFSDPALERLEKAEIDKIIVTDTVPQDQAQEALGDRLIVQEVGSLIGKAIFEIGIEGSVSSIFENNTLYRR